MVEEPYGTPVVAAAAGSINGWDSFMGIFFTGRKKL